MRFSIIALLFLSAVGSASAYSFTSEDIEELIARDTRHCANNAPISKDKEKFFPGCQRSRSLGYLSAHNCRNRGGRSYLCVQGGVATCHTINNAQSRNFENGQCFQ